MGNDQRSQSDFDLTKKAIDEQLGEVNNMEIQKHYTITKDKKVVFNFQHNKDKYELVNKAIENEKEKMKLNDEKEINEILFNLKKSNVIVTKEEERKKYEEFVKKLEEDLNAFKAEFKELFRLFKKNYSSNKSFIQACLDKTISLAEDKGEAVLVEVKEKDEFYETLKKYHRFKEEIEYLDKFFESMHPELKSKLKKKDDLTKFYEEKKYYVSAILDENLKEQVIIMLFAMGKLYDIFKNKNDIIEGLTDLVEKKSTLFMATVKNIKTTNLDYYDSVTEIRDYFELILDQGFIKFIEKEHKDFC